MATRPPKGQRFQTALPVIIVIDRFTRSSKQELHSLARSQFSPKERGIDISGLSGQHIFVNTCARSPPTFHSVTTRNGRRQEVTDRSSSGSRNGWTALQDLAGTSQPGCHLDASLPVTGRENYRRRPASPITRETDLLSRAEQAKKSRADTHTCNTSPLALCNTQLYGTWVAPVRTESQEKMNSPKGHNRSCHRGTGIDPLRTTLVTWKHTNRQSLKGQALE